jgi:hypothetical protein
MATADAVDFFIVRRIRFYHDAAPARMHAAIHQSMACGKRVEQPLRFPAVGCHRPAMEIGAVEARRRVARDQLNRQQPLKKGPMAA